MKDSYFSAVYKYAPVGIIILSGDMKIVNINTFMLSIFSLPAMDYKGQCLGWCLRCASISRSDQVCGETPDCANCNLRQCLTQVLNIGRPVRNATVNHTFIIGGIPIVKILRFGMSTVETSHGDRIIASFSDITQEKQYEQLLTRDLDLNTAPDTINRQNLIGIVAGLMQKAGPDNTISVGLAAVEGLRNADMLNGMSSDDVLSRVAEIARQCTRGQDIIARLGSDLFLFVYSGVGIRMAETITRRIHDTMDAVFGAQGIRGVSFSAGFMELKSEQLPRLSSTDVLHTVESCLDTARMRAGMFVSPDFTALLKQPAVQYT